MREEKKKKTFLQKVLCLKAHPSISDAFIIIVINISKNEYSFEKTGRFCVPQLLKAKATTEATNCISSKSFANTIKKKLTENHHHCH